MGDRIVIWALVALGLWYFLIREEEEEKPKTSTTNPTTTGTPANSTTTQDTSAAKVAAILALMAEGVKQLASSNTQHSDSTSTQHN